MNVSSQEAESTIDELVGTEAGIFLQEAESILVRLTDAGINGSVAGESLRRSLADLAEPSKKAAKLLKGLGVSLEK